MNKTRSLVGALLLAVGLGLAAPTARAEEETLYVNREGLQLLAEPMMGSAAAGAPLDRGLAVRVLARQGFWLRVSAAQPPVQGWAMQFDLSPTAPVGEVNRGAPKNGWQKWQQSVRRMDAKEGGSTAGSRGAGETATALGEIGDFRPMLPKVDAITAFEPTEDLDAFLREGGLVPYFRPETTGGEER